MSPVESSRVERNSGFLLFDDSPPFVALPDVQDTNTTSAISSPGYRANRVRVVPCLLRAAIDIEAVKMSGLDDRMDGEAPAVSL